MSNYDLLIQRLDAFIRKYYLNKLLRGCLIFAAALLSIFLLLGLGEYFLYFPSFLKIILLTLLFFAGLYALIAWIFIPLFKMQRLGKRIAHAQAAKIIGDHFPEVRDKLLNILQLRQQAHPAESRELVAAGIQQKTDEIRLVPFLKAIDLGKNKKYIPYVLPSIVLILVIWAIAPYVFKEATHRLIHPATTFSPPAPFSFSVLNKALKVPLNGDYTLNIETKGTQVPDRVYIVTGNERLLMEQKAKNEFTYTFQKVSQPVSFYLEAGKVHSPDYLLHILEKPIPEGFGMQIIYPAYTGLKEQQVQGLTDISVPEGTILKWWIKAAHTDKVSMRLGMSGKEINLQQKPGAPEWQGSAVITRDTVYSIYLSNKKLYHSDSFYYHVQAIRDENPRVLLQQFKDSINGQQILLSGQASDDYGLTRLGFHYAVSDQNKKVLYEKTEPLPRPSGKIFSVQHYFDLATIDLKPGQQVAYYIIAWDNDVLHGPKQGVSETFVYRMLAKQELDSALNENAQQINQSLSSSATQSKALNKKMEQIQNKLLQTQDIGWEQEQNMKSLLEEHTQLKDQVEAMKRRFEEQKRQSEQKQFSDQIKEKQDALEKQIDQLLNKELAKQLKKLQDLLAQKNKQNAFQNLQELQQENKLFNMDLQRIQELMKKLDLQMKLEDLADKIKDLAQQEKALEQKTAAAKKDHKNLAQEQNDLKKSLQDLMNKDFAALEKANQSQEEPENIAPQKEQGQQAKEAMQRSESQLQQSQSQNAQKAQQQATQQLEQMAASLMKMASGMDLQQVDLNIRAVRQLLTNLLRFSFEQEALMEQEKQVSVSSPLFVKHAEKENILKDNARMIKDSLFALSKKLFHLAPGINRETTELTQHIDQSLDALELRRVADARVSQQYAMANANNLALLLNETLSNLLQMQAQGQQSGQSGGMPQPGKGQSKGPGQMMKDIITGQQQLGEGMKKAGQGKQAGSSGQNGNSGNEAQAEQIARLAQQQAELRRQIQELASMLNSKGAKGSYAKELQEIQEQMNKNETDLVNKRLNATLMQRQQEILTRLLKAEKSIHNQDEDDKRSSKTGKDLPRPMPPELQQYMKAHQDFLDLYKTVPATLKPFYQKMAEQYLKEIK